MCHCHTSSICSERGITNWKSLGHHVGDVMQIAIATVVAATFTISICAQEFLAGSGTPATAFPNPDRPVANIVSPIWHDEKERDNAGEPRQLVRLLGVKSGMTVADIGAGSGYYVVRLSPIVGPRGRIIAEDVVPEYLGNLRSRVRDLGLQNVVISLGEPHDPRLPVESLDIAILVHMYHEIAQPYGLLYNLVPALKPDARVGIVDAYAPTPEHGTPPDLLRCELAAVGYREISLDRLTGSDAYLTIFAPPSVANRTRPETIVACKARVIRGPVPMSDFGGKADIEWSVGNWLTFDAPTPAAWRYSPRSVAREQLGQCPLYPQKRTLKLSRMMSALCQKMG